MEEPRNRGEDCSGVGVGGVEKRGSKPRREAARRAVPHWVTQVKSYTQRDTCLNKLLFMFSSHEVIACERWGAH